MCAHKGLHIQRHSSLNSALAPHTSVLTGVVSKSESSVEVRGSTLGLRLLCLFLATFGGAERLVLDRCVHACVRLDTRAWWHFCQRTRSICCAAGQSILGSVRVVFFNFYVLLWPLSFAKSNTLPASSCCCCCCCCCCCSKAASFLTAKTPPPGQYPRRLDTRP